MPRTFTVFNCRLKKIGIQLAHAGVILLLVGQLATDMLAHETQINFTEVRAGIIPKACADYELIFTRRRRQLIVAIPAKLLQPGDAPKIDSLPFAIRVKSFWKNSDANFRPPMMQNAPPIANNGVAVEL